MLGAASALDKCFLQQMTCPANVSQCEASHLALSAPMKRAMGPMCAASTCPRWRRSRPCMPRSCRGCAAGRPRAERPRPSLRPAAARARARPRAALPARSARRRQQRPGAQLLRNAAPRTNGKILGVDPRDGRLLLLGHGAEHAEPLDRPHRRALRDRKGKRGPAHLFVPAYDHGKRPFGTFVAERST